MRGIQIGDEVYNDLFKSSVWAKAGYTITKQIGSKEEATKIEESEAPKEGEEEILVEDEEIHTCPLCESKLEVALSDDKLQEHVNYVFSILNEAFDTDESLDETPVEEESNADSETK